MHLGTFLCRPLQNNNVKWLNFTYFCERAMANFRIFFWNALGACLAWASFYTDRRTEHFYTVAIFEGKIQIHFIPGIVPAFAVFTLRFNEAFVKHWNWGSNYYAFWFKDSNYTEVKWKKRLKVKAMNNASTLVIKQINLESMGLGKCLIRGFTGGSYSADKIQYNTIQYNNLYFTSNLR